MLFAPRPTSEFFTARDDHGRSQCIDHIRRQMGYRVRRGYTRRAAARRKEHDTPRDQDAKHRIPQTTIRAWPIDVQRADGTIRFPAQRTLCWYWTRRTEAPTHLGTLRGENVQMGHGLALREDHKAPRHDATASRRRNSCFLVHMTLISASPPSCGTVPRRAPAGGRVIRRQ